MAGYRFTKDSFFRSTLLLARAEVEHDGEPTGRLALNHAARPWRWQPGHRRGWLGRSGSNRQRRKCQRVICSALRETTQPLSAPE